MAYQQRRDLFKLNDDDDDPEFGDVSGTVSPTGMFWKPAKEASKPRLGHGCQFDIRQADM